MEPAVALPPLEAIAHFGASRVGFLSQKRCVHLLGSKGSGMRSLGALLASADWHVTCSDDTDRIVTDDPCPEAELVIASLAIPDDHPELVQAQRRGIPVLRYPEALGKLTSDFRAIAVAGTHGKSTTAAMLTDILVTAGYDPTSVYGAQPLDKTHGGRLGQDEWIVAEACEYRQSLLQLKVEAAAILNVEHDHVDCYPQYSDVVDTFARFAGRLPANGYLLVPEAARVNFAASCKGSIETFGCAPSADWQACGFDHQRGCFSFDVVRKTRKLGRIQLGVPGHHNAMNALAAAALATYAGCRWSSVEVALAQFVGLKRRLEIIRDDARLAIVDDYAHHPTEIAAALTSIRQIWPQRRIWCVFQPHQASRTERLFDALASSLRNADKVIVADIFRAREPAAKPGDVTAADLAQRTAQIGGDVADVHDQPSIERYLSRQLLPGDVLVTMGAGDIGKIAHGFGKWF
jgi:UDP-N-acetylmuramate--alanine ligase